MKVKKPQGMGEVPDSWQKTQKELHEKLNWK